MRNAYAVRLAIYVLFYAWAGSPCWSQGFDVHKSTGLPNSIYSGSQIEVVDTASGNLRVSIPLLHLPGRGLDTDIVMTYSSKIWKTDEYTDPFGWPAYTTSMDGIGVSPSQGWVIGVPRMGRSWGGAGDVCLDIDPEGGYCYSWISYFNWVTNEGQKFFLGNDNGPQPAITSTTDYWSFDGTYMRVLDANSDNRVARYKDGVAVTYSYSGGQAVLKDTSGNYISCAYSPTLVFGTCTDTLGRLVTFNYSNGLLQSITYVDSSGTTRAITFTYQTFTLEYPLAWLADTPCPWINPNCAGMEGGPASLLTRVSLPNNLSYEFSYVLTDPPKTNKTTGEIAKITLPTGGYIRYTYAWTKDWTGGPGVEARWLAHTRTIATRVVSEDGTSGGERTWTYDVRTMVSGVPTSTVTDPLGGQQVISAGPAGIPSTIQDKNQTGTVLHTVGNTVAWDNSSYIDPNPNAIEPSNVRIASQTTTLNDTNQKSKVEFTYGTHGNVTERKEYDWGAGAVGPLARRTTFAYLHNANSLYAGTGVHILDRKTSESVYSPTSVLKAQTLYEYDNTGITNTSGTPSPQHDYTSHPYTNTKRGNLTKVKRWKNTTGTFLTTTNTYNDVGNLLQTTDPGLHITTFSYTDNYTDGINRNSRAFVTQTTLPMTGTVNHIERSQYFFNSGLVSASCGENFPAATTCTNTLTPPQPDYTKYTYDLLNRLLTVVEADGGQTTLAYNEGALPITATSTTKIDSTQNLVNTAIYDGLGRTKQTQQNSNPLCVVKVDVTYDEIGRQKTVTNPYCTTGDPTYGITTYNYDALSRATSVVSPTGGSVTTSYSGNTTTVTDQQGKKRKSEIDGLGRLIRVWEPDAGQNLVHITRYQYDEMDNLLCVHQKSTDATADKACTDATVPATWRPRKFTYNSLSQTTQTANPESGTVNYTSYDADGNLLTRTDARSVTTTYSYDALHRPTSKSYTDSTATATYTYDISSVDGLTLLNPVGRLVKSSTSNTRTVSSYDVRGRVRDQWQCTPANCGSGWHSSPYQYNFAGQVTTQTNPIGFTLTHTYNAAAQLMGIYSTWSPGTVVSGITYNAPGAITQMTHGNGLVETRTLNNRLQPIQMRTYDPGPGTDKLNLTYGFADVGGMNNGNVMSWSATGMQNFSRTYTYDEVNRLKTMTWTGGPCNYTWDYDIWGNRLNQDATSGPGPCGEHFPTVLTSNRIAELGYDAAGNVTSEGSTTYQYDAENHMISINGGGSNPVYVHDADGRRARKTVGGANTDFIYDASGNVIAERQGATWTRGYMYLGGQLLMQYDNIIGPAITFAVHKDHLGSTRLLTKVDKSLQECNDYYPYGELIPCGAPTTTSSHKFTGKERDAESNLDYFIARYYASGEGRFRSPDPGNAGAKSSDPQSWNAYAYARNNPLLFIDPTGKNVVVCLGDNDKDQNTKSQLGSSGNKQCWDLTDQQYEDFRRNNPDIRQTPSGDLEWVDPNGPNVKIGTATYYNEKIPEALIQAGHMADTGVTAAMIITAPNFAVAAWAQLSLGGAEILFVNNVGHHPLPKFLSGLQKQILSRISPRLHAQFHNLLRNELRRRGFPNSMMGGKGGSTQAWAEYMARNPGAQRTAIDAVLKVARSIDSRYGTQLVKEVIQNIAKGNLIPLP